MRGCEGYGGATTSNELSQGTKDSRISISRAYTELCVPSGHIQKERVEAESAVLTCHEGGIMRSESMLNILWLSLEAVRRDSCDYPNDSLMLDGILKCQALTL